VITTAKRLREPLERRPRAFDEGQTTMTIVSIIVIVLVLMALSHIQFRA
jgi:hypothetical protein